MPVAPHALPSSRAASPRNVGVLAASIGALSAGEELWLAYLPACLSALGASGVWVGGFASARELLDSAYQIPAGHLTERIGYKRALLLFTATATVGYAIYAVAPAWPFMFLGLAAAMAWKAGAFPLTFAVVGESLPAERRATAFAVQSILVRLPRVVCAPAGGLLIASLGVLAGFRVLCAVTVVVAIAVLLLQRYGFGDEVRHAPVQTQGRQRRELSPELRRLLTAECLVRFGEGIAASFIVLYVTQVSGRSILEFGTLYAVQQAVAIASYLPGARLTAWTGRPSAVALTFFFFAVFPLAVAGMSSYRSLIVAFVIGGLKEIGEPARKALIVDLTSTDRRPSEVGRYYAVRNVLIVPAGVVGGLLWQQAPHLPMVVAFVVSMAGLVIFATTHRARI